MEHTLFEETIIYIYREHESQDFTYSHDQILGCGRRVRTQFDRLIENVVEHLKMILAVERRLVWREEEQCQNRSTVMSQGV